MKSCFVKRRKFFVKNVKKELTFNICYDILLAVVNMNNLKLIREIYGATQEEIATFLGVSRVSIANWENSEFREISKTNLEKLSIFYGIGPEFFYSKKIDDDAVFLIKKSRNRAVHIDLINRTKKEEQLNQMFESENFKSAIHRYVLDMKIVLALSDEADIETIKLAIEVNKKMGKRLEGILYIREQEEERRRKNKEKTWAELVRALEEGV